MKKNFFVLFFVFSAITSFAQQEFFLYIQTDHNQAFYARINTLIYSSTENGYMIIPKLRDSVYDVTIGFAKNAFPEQSFSIPINKNDRGYHLDNLNEKGWALVDLQSSGVIMNSGRPLKTVSEFSGTKKTDAFSEMLASVVNDTAILYSAVTPKPTESTAEKETPAIIVPADKNNNSEDSAKITVPANPPITAESITQPDLIAKTDTVSIGNIATVAEPPAKISAVISNPDSGRIIDSEITKKVINDKPFIIKIEERKTDDMYQAVYLEQYNFNTDTIKISIPLTDSTIGNATPAKALVDKKIDPASDQQAAAAETAVSSNSIVADTTASMKKAVQIINSDCKDFATDYDVDKLRIKILSNETVDDKLATVKKYLKTKCLSVKQIKALTELFPSDETKYRFFDLSYPFVSDSNNFYLLEDLIENTYYKNRFKAMIQK